MAYELIETIEIGAGGAASIEFTSIPQDGVDLLLKLSLRTDYVSLVNDYAKLELNGTTTNFTVRWLEGNGSAASSSSLSLGYLAFIGAAGATASTFGNSSLLISNYASSTNKSFSYDAVTENNGTSALQSILAGQWANTSAITSVTLKPNFGTNFDQYSTASLYKIY